MSYPGDVFKELRDLISGLERRVVALESEVNLHRRLGPQPKDLVPDPIAVQKLVEVARRALQKEQ